jgi:2-polyprenyl-3-methyl-5-hydroxy-6-metoxy-1,4-benzoquinol methylase
MATEPLREHARRAARRYGAAAEHYGLASLGLWDRFRAAAVSRLGLAAADSVLDLCCGAGASASPAARAVGAAGHVLGIDVAGALLELARARAAREGLASVESARATRRAPDRRTARSTRSCASSAFLRAGYGGVRGGDVAAGPSRMVRWPG